MRRKIEHSLEVISKAIEKYPNIAVASSFGKDSIVTLALCLKVKPDIQVFSIMTPFKPHETLDYKEIIEKEWNLNIKTYVAPELGLELYKSDPEVCCEHYKVDQTRLAIHELGLDAWITGLRCTEGTKEREKFTEEIEDKNGLIKVNPILHWTEADVWLFHALEGIPVHPLYAEGYRSLGCLPCSEPYSDTERGGRWKGTCKEGQECGIHTQSLKS